MGAGEPSRADDWVVDGDALRILRNRRGLSQAELARRSGVRQQHISTLERRATQARLGTVLHLARALDTPVAALVAGHRSALTGGHELVAPDAATAHLAQRLDCCTAKLQEIGALVQQLAAMQRELHQALSEIDAMLDRGDLTARVAGGE